ncbi:MAG: hypothetical protein KDD69_04885 [Bdellovibrionales bacterium]|nr:hypothetical protein [Bdellovibrionales bacterium]
MPDLTRFRALSVRERAIVAIAVLLDGHDAAQYLAGDKARAAALCRAAKDLAELSPELRLPLVGTLLRESVAQSSDSTSGS